METWPVRACGLEELMVIPRAVACPRHGLGCILGGCPGVEGQGAHGGWGEMRVLLGADGAELVV